ncbi:MAG TPA: glycosyltransferase family 4 protein, partial [Verrucomicrobiae bacterium]
MRFLFINQAFYPDVMATGQYLADVAVALAGRGHEVTVIASRRGYDDPQRMFPKEEMWRGVRVLRVGSTGFGKAAKWRRAADFGSFLVLCVLRLARLPRADVIVALTSPPLISFVGAWLARLRGSRFVYWVMDLNPDEAIAAGWLRAGSLAARLLEGMSRFSLRQAAKVLALDRFMRERIVAKGIAPEKIVVAPPWTQDGEIRFDAAGRERFRAAHGLEGKFVVMYSGNHSPCHPLKTLVAAAEWLGREEHAREGEAEIVFCFVGGGSEWGPEREIRRPKSEIRKKSEGRRPKPKTAGRDQKGETTDYTDYTETEVSSCRAPKQKTADPEAEGRRREEIRSPNSADRDQKEETTEYADYTEEEVVRKLRQSTNPSIHQSTNPL